MWKLKAIMFIKKNPQNVLQPLLGHDPVDLQALYLSSLKTKERALRQNQSHQWLIG